MRAVYLVFLIVMISACQRDMIPQDVGSEVDTWTITQGRLVYKNMPTDSLVAGYWKHVRKLLPHDLLNQYISSIRLYTDGKQQDLGGMNQIDETNENWQIDLDTADINLHNLDSSFVLDYTHTLIHEYGHLLTLNADQIEPTQDEVQNDSRGYLTSEGYALKASYLGMFVDQFWTPDFLSEWDKVDKVRNESRRGNKLFKLYLENEDQFVTDYAAESPEEDIAESWTFFVLSDKPLALGAKAEKVLFFYQFEELIRLRTMIRSNMKTIPNKYLEAY